MEHCHSFFTLKNCTAVDKEIRCAVLNHSDKDDLEAKIVMLYSTQSIGEKITDAEKASHKSNIDRRNHTDVIFSPRKPGRKPKTESEDDTAKARMKVAINPTKP